MLELRHQPAQDLDLALGRRAECGMPALPLHRHPALARGKQAGYAQTGSRSDHRDRGSCHRPTAADLSKLVRLQRGHGQRKRGEIIDHMQPIQRENLARGLDRESPGSVGELHEIAGDAGGNVERSFANPGIAVIGKVAANRLLEALELGAAHHLLLLWLAGAVGNQRETCVGTADVTDQPHRLAHRYSSFGPARAPPGLWLQYAFDGLDHALDSEPEKFEEITKIG